jgi:hypothetical protein
MASGRARSDTNGKQISTKVTAKEFNDVYLKKLMD